MDEGVLVEVFLPAVQKYFDVVLPIRFTIGQIKESIFSMLQECNREAVLFHDESILYLSDRKIVLDDQQVIFDLGLQHGDEIIIW